jgi:CDP-glucose 4,6-dehydratase
VNRINPELVFHLAAQALVLDSYEKPLETFQVNILGTANLLESLKSTNATGVVVATTDKVYKNDDSGKLFKEKDELWGHDPYSLSKTGTEITVAAWRNLPSLKRCKFVTVRAGNVFGPGDRAGNRLFPDLISGIRERKEVVIRNPNSIRPWQYVLDPIIGYVLVGKQILLNHEVSDSYNFGPKDNSFFTVAELIALVCELAPLKTLTQSNFNRVESKVLKLNSELATSELGWTSQTELTQGVLYTLDLDSAKMEVSDIYKHLEVYLSVQQDSFVE